MSLIKCPDCGKKFSDTANNCPNCGYELTAERKKELIDKQQKELRQGGVGCLVIIIIIILISISKNCSYKGCDYGSGPKIR